MLTPLADAESRLVAITVDDLPVVANGDGHIAEHVNHALVKAFVRHGVRATGFVNEQKAQQIGTERGRRLLKFWIQHGQDLGNHTFSHADLNHLTPAEFMDEVIRGEATFRGLLPQGGKDALFLRFPFNHSGDTAAKQEAVRALLAERGYRVAVCTIDNSDYQFARAYDVMLQRSDTSSAQRLRADYLAHTAAVVDYYAGLHRRVFGRETSHVMLLHANRLNADVIDELLAIFQRLEFRFVTLAQAQSDPVYSTPDPATRFGPMWAYRWARRLGVRVDGSLEPEPPSWIQTYPGE